MCCLEGFSHFILQHQIITFDLPLCFNNTKSNERGRIAFFVEDRGTSFFSVWPRKSNLSVLSDIEPQKSRVYLFGFEYF